MNQDTDSTQPWSGPLDERNGWHVASFDPARHDPSEVVVFALATIADADPGSLQPLHRSIDPDALDSLFAPTFEGDPRLGGEITFVHDGYAITVDHAGKIRVRDVTDATDDAVTGLATGSD